MTNLEEFNAKLLCGEPSVEPRIVPAPVRMPFPPAKGQGSIYENQFGSKKRYFAFDQLAEKKELAGAK